MAPKLRTVTNIADLSLNRDSFTYIIISILRNGYSLKMRVKGTSMFPFIKENDLLTILPPEKAFARLGTIVCFINPINRSITIHRVIDCNKDYYITKGDNCHAEDGRVIRTDILGIVTRVERKGLNVRYPLHYGARIISIISKLDCVLYRNAIFKKACYFCLRTHRCIKQYLNK